MIILDTNIISERMTPNPDPRITHWAESIAGAEMALTAITVHKIRYGILRLGETRKSTDLAARWAVFRSLLSASQVLPFDEVAAEMTARIAVDCELRGISIPSHDAQIAGICLAHRASLATRNEKDFEAIAGLELINPYL